MNLLIPKPKIVKRKSAFMKLAGNVALVLSKNVNKKMYTVNFLKDFLSEKGIRLYQTTRPVKKDLTIYLGLGDDIDNSFFKRFSCGQKLKDSEGAYVLCVKKGIGIGLVGKDEQGLYYATCTLRQMLNLTSNEQKIPEVEISDWPDMRYRMVMFDVARERNFNMEYMKKIIDQLSRYKINMFMLYLEYRFAFPSHPLIGPKKSLTPTQAIELDKFARERFVELIPQVNCLGHMEGIINLENYSDLAEEPGKGQQACPSNPELIPFLENLYSDVSKPFATKFLHVGGDESWQLGECPKCAKRAKRIGKEGLYLYHIKKIYRISKKLQKRMMLWGDMLLTYPEICDRLPKDIIIFDWHYWDSSPKTMRFFRKKGFDIFVCPAADIYWSNFIKATGSYENITQMIADGHKTAAMGECTCVWEICKGAFFEYCWYHLVLSAECSWNNQKINQKTFTRAFTKHFFGYDGDEIWEFIRLIGRDMTKTCNLLSPRSGRRLRHRFFSPNDPFNVWREFSKEWTPPVRNKIKKILNRAEKIMKIIESKSKHNKEIFKYLRFPMILYQFALRQVEKIDEAKRYYARAARAQKRDKKIYQGNIRSAINALKSLLPDYDQLIAFFSQANKEIGASEIDVQRLQHAQHILMEKMEYIRSCSFSGKGLLQFEMIIRPDFFLNNQAQVQ